MKTKISLSIITYCLCAMSLQSLGQNIISNPSFENGSTVTWTDQVYKATGWSKDCGLTYAPNVGPPDYGVPSTPDLFDKNCPNLTEDQCVGVPLNKWATLNERTNKNRYVNLSGGSTHIYDNQTIVSYGETVKGTLNAGLVANCVYTISFYAAAVQGNHINGSQFPPIYQDPDPNYNKIQVVLRKDDDCDNGLVIFESTNVSLKTWTLYTGTYVFNSQMATYGFNRIEFRLTPYPLNYSSNGSHTVFLDDVNLEKTNTPISPDFSITTYHAPGSPTYTITANTQPIPLGSSFWWEVSEVDVNGNIIQNTTLTNPPSWWDPSLLLHNPFPGYCCQTNVIVGNGTFYYGHRYRITRATWGPCTSWSTKSYIVYIGPGDDDNGSFARDVNSIEPVDYNNFNPIQINQIDENNLLPNQPSTSNSELAAITISPNPCTNLITIHMTDPKLLISIRIKLFNGNGQEINIRKNAYLFNNDILLDMTQVQAGMYFLHVSSSNLVYTFKIIKTDR